MSYKNLANKGRYGDTELRKVDGRLSHVNREEADIIDLWMTRGEQLVQDLGSGTINPLTGLPEYSWLSSIGKKAWKAVSDPESVYDYYTFQLFHHYDHYEHTS